ncbi:hypothetical protein SLEP1_g39289 [Rubroshorea leprosula]|uniref:Reverse transcriptase domain-containing protein n=1 Tax=Rubroshorea leprosula TaxID=152421 RepID=A0AAV5KZY9_9ROSI|nr:hypothetical protein SLEP1_g39289 [Rubroshorea leprosula]
MSTALETHSMQSEDDGHELNTNVISGEDDDSIDVEPLHKEGFLNSRLQEITACNNNANFDLPREFGEANGHDAGEANDEGNGLIGSAVHNGLEESIGFTQGPTNEVIKDNEEEPMGEDLEDSSTAHKEIFRDGMGKRRRKITNCYPEELTEIRKERAAWVTARTKQRGLGSMLKRKEVAKLVRVERPDFLFLQETKLEEMDEGLCGMVWHSKGDGYLGIKGLWGVKKEMCYFVNVYAPTNRTKKAELWAELRQMIMEEGGRWLIVGDFNAVHSIEERRGKTGESLDMKEFNDFIEAVGLVDHKLANRRFTWYRPDGTSMSRLDRVLMTTEMTELGGEWVQQGLKRTISDHCAIIMKTRVSDWGPKPFRVLDVWQQHPEFKRVVEEQWNAMAVDGFAGYRCKLTLKMLKEFLREWNKGVLGDIEAQFERAAAKVAHVDIKNEEFTLDEDEVHERQKGFQETWDSMRKREALWRQKSRSNWVKLGDANTRFFHKIANGRKACNGIVGLSCDGQWVEEPELVKKVAVDYFQKLFCGESWNRPKPSSIIFKQISEEMKVWLERSFLVKEIEDGLKSSKVLANRLKEVMSQIISDTQSAFVGGRQLVDGVLVLNEVVEEVKRRKHQAFIFKADFEKAYDCVDWSFLDWMMNMFGFGVRWRGWIKECLSTARISMLVNGSPIEEFTMGKGLRQGDPLSPFLFLMIAEGLHGLVKKAETEGLLHGIDVGSKGLTISLLQFADDTVILGKANEENIFTVKTILRWFELMSGLRINFCKSSIVGFNVAQRWLNGAATVLRCGVRKLPFVYLGMPVGGNPGTKKSWDPVLNKFRTKLAVWKSACCPLVAALLCLIRYSLPYLFFMSLFLAPNCMVSELIRIQRDFLWGGAELKRKIPWVSWEMVCRSKEKGGLGVTDLRRRNWALLGKWWFRLGDGGESLWKQVVWDKYYGGRREVDIRAVDSVRVSRIWRDVISVEGKSIQLQDMLGKGFRWMVGDGRRVGFWHEIWVGDKSLRDLCPRLFELAMKKDGMVCEMGGGKGAYGDGILTGEEGEERYAVKKAYEFLSPMESILPDQIWRELGACLFLIGSWYIWYWRNIRVFQNKGECRDGLLHMIQSKMFLWIKNKVVGSLFSLFDWQFHPLECATAIRKHRSPLREFRKHKNGEHAE